MLIATARELARTTGAAVLAPVVRDGQPDTVIARIVGERRGHAPGCPVFELIPLPGRTWPAGTILRSTNLIVRTASDMEPVKYHWVSSPDDGDMRQEELYGPDERSRVYLSATDAKEACEDCRHELSWSDPTSDRSDSVTFNVANGDTLPDWASVIRHPGGRLEHVDR